jgi:glutathione S-transferase
MSINFYHYDKQTNQPSPSGYCQKLETYLRATQHQDYNLIASLPFTAPKGKLPYVVLEHDGITTSIADSHFILKHLISTGVIKDLDDGLSDSEKADSRAWQAWTEELVYPALCHTRWLRPENFKVMAANIPAPWIIAPVLSRYFRYRIGTALYGHGVGRHSNEEIDVLLKEYVDALEKRLEGPEWFHGAKMSGIDIIVYAFLVNALGEKGNPEYTSLILGSDGVRKVITRGTKLWFPEYEGVLEDIEKAGNSGQ